MPRREKEPAKKAKGGSRRNVDLLVSIPEEQSNDSEDIRQGNPAAKKKPKVIDPRYKPPKEDESDDGISDEELVEYISSEEAFEEEYVQRATTTTATRSSKVSKRKLADPGDSKYIPLGDEESSEEISDDDPRPNRKKRVKFATTRVEQLSRPRIKVPRTSQDGQISQVLSNTMPPRMVPPRTSQVAQISRLVSNIMPPRIFPPQPQQRGNVISNVWDFIRQHPAKDSGNSSIEKPNKSPTTPKNDRPKSPITPQTRKVTGTGATTQPAQINIVPPTNPPTPVKLEPKPKALATGLPTPDPTLAKALVNNMPNSGEAIVYGGRARKFNGTKQSPEVIFATPKVQKDPRIRDWPPYPGTVYCMPCFTLDVLKALRIRRNTLHTLRLLGGNGALRSFIDLQSRMDKLEQEASRFLVSGSGFLREGDLIHPPGTMKPPVAFHDRLPPDLKGLIQLRYFAHELTGPNRKLERAFPSVVAMLEAIRKDLHLTTNQISNIEGRYISSIFRTTTSRKLPPTQPGTTTQPPDNNTNLTAILDGKQKTPPLKTDPKYTDSTKEGASIIQKLKDLTTEILTWERDQEAAAASQAAPQDPTTKNPLPPLSSRKKAAHAAHWFDTPTAREIRALEKRLGIPTIPTTDNENLNHHLDVRSYLKIERRIYNGGIHISSTKLDLSASEHSSHPRWPCNYCAGSDAANKHSALRPYPRNLEVDERRAWEQTARWVFPSILEGRDMGEVKTGEFEGLLRRTFEVGDLKGDEEVFSEDEGWVEKGDKGKKAVSDLQRMRGFEFVYCKVMADEKGAVDRWKTRVILLGMRNVFEEIRSVGRA